MGTESGIPDYRRYVHRCICHEAILSAFPLLSIFKNAEFLFYGSPNGAYSTGFKPLTHQVCPPACPMIFLGDTFSTPPLFYTNFTDLFHLLWSYS